jgi:hypothetical protein
VYVDREITEVVLEIARRNNLPWQVLVGRRSADAGGSRGDLIVSRDLRGLVPETWKCVDCGINTHPGSVGRTETERYFNGAALMAKEPSLEIEYGSLTEVYHVRAPVWQAAGVELCVGCIERRLGRELTPRDFKPGHPFNRLPGTARLRQRRGDRT